MPQIYHPDKLPPLPEPDGAAEAEQKPHPDGGYTFKYVDAWSEPMVRAYAAAAVAAERERCAKLVETQNTNGDYGVKGWFDLLAAKIRAADKAD